MFIFENENSLYQSAT